MTIQDAQARIKKVDNALVIITKESPEKRQNICLNLISYTDFNYNDDTYSNAVLIQPSNDIKLDFWIDSTDGYGEILIKSSEVMGSDVRCIVFEDEYAADYLRQILGGVSS